MIRPRPGRPRAVNAIPSPIVPRAPGHPVIEIGLIGILGRGVRR